MWQKHRDWRLRQVLASRGISVHYMDGTFGLPPFTLDDPFEKRYTWVCPWRGEGGWDQTLEHLREVCRHEGPFDGILGYSQGAAVAGAIAALAAVGDFQVGLKFAVIISGYLPREPDLQARLYNMQEESWSSPWNVGRGEHRKSFRFPTMHIIGEVDQVSPAWMTLQMASLFDEPVVERHKGGHRMVFDAPRLCAILAFMRRFTPPESRLAPEEAAELCDTCVSWSSEDDGGGRASDNYWYCGSCWARYHARLNDEADHLLEEFVDTQQDPEATPESLIHWRSTAWDAARVCEGCAVPGEDRVGWFAGSRWYCEVCWREWRSLDASA